MKKLILFLSLILIVNILTSCSEDGCVQGNVSLLTASLFTAENQKPFIFDSVSVRGIDHEKDSLLLKKALNVKMLQLPINGSKEKTAYEIYNLRNKQKDTITLFHQNIDYFISLDCGCAFFFHIDSIKHTKYQIDSIRLINPEITNQNGENIRIYYKMAI